MKRIFLLLLICCLYFCVEAQTSVPVDSVASTANSAAIRLMQQAENQQLTDSIRREILLQEIAQLRQHETSQRTQLQLQLQAIQRQDSIRTASTRKRIDSLKLHAAGAPIIIGQDTICKLYTNIGSFSAAERAQHCSERIVQVAKVFSLKNDSLSVIAGNHSTDIIFNGEILFGITEMDALWQETDQQTLAQEYKNRIVQGIGRYQESISLLTILKQIGLCLLVILGQYLLVKGVNYLFRRILDEKIKARKNEWFNGIKIRTFEVLNADRQVNTLLFVSKMFRYLVNLLQFYITIPILFSIFPVTQRLAETLFGWILSPVTTIVRSFINYLPKLFMIIIIVIIIRYIVKFLRYLSNEIATENLKISGFYPDWARATFNILRIFLYAFMLVMIFPLLPSSNTEIFKGVSVFIGIVFSLGSSSIIANLVAGMVVTYMRPFKTGDRIKIGDISGDVIEKSPFVIRIKTYKNEIITVPNSNILSSNVVNYSFSAAENGLILHTTVTIGYDVPWKQVHMLLLRAAGRTQYILDDPKPFVLQTSLDDFYVSYELCAYTREATKQAGIYSELHQHIQDCFFEDQVEIMSPHYRANRNGNPTAIPADYLNKANSATDGRSDIQV